MSKLREGCRRAVVSTRSAEKRSILEMLQLLQGMVELNDKAGQAGK